MKTRTELRIGTSIKPKSIFKDPCFEDMDMSNWQGRIIGFRDDDVSVEWDSITLNSFSDD